MSDFVYGHAAHADWREALRLAAAQLDAQARGLDAGPFTLGFVYFSDHYGAHAEALLSALQQRWPATEWVGSVGVGVCAGACEYFDEPALALMLASVPTGRFEVFSGARPLHRIDVHSALVHADPATPDLPELIAEMSDRTASGYIFGGLASSRAGTVHVAQGVWRGGLSGVGFSADVALVSRVTQGSQPIGPVHRVTRAERNVVLELDGRPALGALLDDLGISRGDDPRAVAPKLRGTLVGLINADDAVLERGGQFGVDVRVRHLMGLDPGREAIALADVVEPGMQLAFCTRNPEAARRDLVRICSEIRDEVESPSELPLGAGAADDPEPAAARRMLGAIYVSCAGRGGPHFGAPSAELQIVRRALGEVPLVGFFAAGEIAHHHLYSYTGVLTVFTGH